MPVSYTHLDVYKRQVLDIAPEKVAYSVKYGKQQLLEDSRLGFEFDSGEFGAGLRCV